MYPGVAEPRREGVEDLGRFGEGPLSRSSGEPPDGRFPELDNKGEGEEGEACVGDAGRAIRNGFFFFSSRGRPQPHLRHF